MGQIYHAPPTKGDYVGLSEKKFPGKLKGIAKCLDIYGLRVE